jgi:hypothetical protein
MVRRKRMRLLRTIIVVTTIVFWGSGIGIVNSEEVSSEQARQIAVSWMAEKTGVARQGLHENQSDNLVCTGIERDFRTIAYLFEKPEGGFVLVAGGDKIGTVIAYSEANKFDQSIPPVKKFLDIVYEVMSEGDISAEQENIHSLGQVKSAAVGKIGPLLQTQWSQGPPYNKYCPPITYYLWPHPTHTYCIECTVDKGYGVGYTAVGCVAVAMGQIMRYHRHPAQGTGDHEYVWEHITCCPNCGVTGHCPGADEGLYANFEGNYDWNNMATAIDLYSSDAQIDAVSRLLYRCGVAVEMNYGCSLCGGSGAYSADVRDALRRYFDYESSVEYVGRDFDSPQWFSMLSEEITNNRPVYYDGRWTGGHAFVLDGVDDRTGTTGQLFVHLNYGWGGSSDAWYDMGLFWQFCLDHHVVLGVCPRNGSAGGVSGQPNAPTSPGGPGASGGGCFVATAAYGSGLAGEVRVLSDFRDRYLLKTRAGERLVGAYYVVSPPIARIIARNDMLKKMVRLHLKPYIALAQIIMSKKAS